LLGLLYPPGLQPLRATLPSELLGRRTSLTI
jgi:hypothetical protein